MLFIIISIALFLHMQLATHKCTAVCSITPSRLPAAPLAPVRQSVSCARAATERRGWWHTTNQAQMDGRISMFLIFFNCVSLMFFLVHLFWGPDVPDF